MSANDTPIRQKLMKVMLQTSGVVLLVTCTAFFAYEFITFRQTTLRQLATLAEIIATNSTAALAFDSEDEGIEILGALKAEKHIIGAILFDETGKPFAQYIRETFKEAMPSTPGDDGFLFTNAFVEGFHPVYLKERKLGTLYLRSDLGAIYDRFRLYAFIAFTVVIVSFVIAYFISKSFQGQISGPIMALADTARIVSTDNDYSVRAAKHGNDEVGKLTDAFNSMLMRIEEQNDELREAEGRMRAVLNSSLTAVLVIDDQGRITEWNQQAEKIFGWSASEAVGQLIGTIVPERYRIRHWSGFQQYINTGSSPIIGKFLEAIALHKDGHEFPVELSVSVIMNHGNIAFCGFATDITERKKAEEKIKEFNQQLEVMVNERTEELKVANKEMESFSYSVSHDLRAPLRSINGYVTILAEDYDAVLDEEGKRLLTVVSNNAQRMGRLIDDLLEFSKLGRKELVKSDVNTAKLVTNMVAELTSENGYSKVGVTIGSLPAVKADYNLISQVWINLISNGLKYSSKKEKPSVEIGASADNGQVVFYVKDNGAGFNMDYAHKLFGVFQRLHKATEFEGTGVGLAIVHRIVTRHGGKIWAEGKVNEGAAFYFTVPE
jgi:PAS domain S-box-containing protein